VLVLLKAEGAKKLFLLTLLYIHTHFIKGEPKESYLLLKIRMWETQETPSARRLYSKIEKGENNGKNSTGISKIYYSC